MQLINQKANLRRIADDVTTSSAPANQSHIDEHLKHLHEALDRINKSTQSENEDTDEEYNENDSFED